MARLDYNMIIKRGNGLQTITPKSIKLSSSLLTWAYVNYGFGFRPKNWSFIKNNYDLSGNIAKLRTPQRNGWIKSRIAKVNLHLIFNKEFNANFTFASPYKNKNPNIRTIYFANKQVALPTFSSSYGQSNQINQQNFQILVNAINGTQFANYTPYAITTYIQPNFEMLVDVYDPPIVNDNKKAYDQTMDDIMAIFNHYKQILDFIRKNSHSDATIHYRTFETYDENGNCIGLDKMLIDILERNAVEEFLAFECDEYEEENIYCGKNGVYIKTIF